MVKKISTVKFYRRKNLSIRKGNGMQLSPQEQSFFVDNGVCVATLSMTDAATEGEMMLPVVICTTGPETKIPTPIVSQCQL